MRFAESKKLEVLEIQGPHKIINKEIPIGPTHPDTNTLMGYPLRDAKRVVIICK